MIQRPLSGVRKAQTASRVTGHLAHPDVSATPPFVHFAGESESLRPGSDIRCHPPDQFRHQRRRNVVGIRQVRTGDRTVEGDVVTERRRRLVRHRHAAEMQEQTGIERITDVVVIEVGAPSQRGSDQARAHRRPRRQPETQISDHRQTTEKIHQTEALRHGSTVGARAITAVETHGQNPGRSAGWWPGRRRASGRRSRLRVPVGSATCWPSRSSPPATGSLTCSRSWSLGWRPPAGQICSVALGSWSWGPPAMR